MDSIYKIIDVVGTSKTSWEELDMAIEPIDFETGWFGQHGSLGRAHALFGDLLRPIVADLNEKLAG